jgi:hypothetical protein
MAPNSPRRKGTDASILRCYTGRLQVLQNELGDAIGKLDRLIEEAASRNVMLADMFQGEDAFTFLVEGKAEKELIAVKQTVATRIDELKTALAAAIEKAPPLEPPEKA